MTETPSTAGLPAPRTRAAAKPALDLSAERLADLLGLIYESALKPDTWAIALSALREVFDGNYVSLIVRPGSGDDLGLIVSAAGDHRTIDPNNPPLSLSPFSGMLVDRVVTVDDVLTEQDWRASAYFRDWCLPHDVFHVMAVDIQTRDGGVYGLRITRGDGAVRFSLADRARCQTLLGHLRRALDLHLSVNQDRQVNKLYGQAMAHLMVGAVVLDEQGKVLECNPMAKAIFEMNDGLVVNGGQVEATYAADNRRLQRLVREVLDNTGRPARLRPAEAISISRPSGKVSWGLVVQAISPDRWTEGKHRPCAAVFVRDSDSKAMPPVRLAQELFQLTAAETMLAIQLANGLSLEEAAEALNIRRNTARAHLRSIFSKTGVRRQTELVRIFLNSVVLLGAAD
ncbi:MAG: helix-turn-helix transcriptional regulator [Ideonella sp.]|jgi:DNA-binding CsgD family transcriptional regulator/PAS domain-containing protein|nr:helix-turn-helix transcriptional regulator [Ideonella sp.]